MKMFRRRRLYSILGFLVAVACIFFCFQLFSLGVLNDENARESRLSRLDHNHPHGELPPSTKKAQIYHGRRLVTRSTQNPRYLDIQHVPAEACLPGTECAKKKLDTDHAGEVRQHKFVDGKTPRIKPASDQKQDLLESNKQLLFQVETFDRFIQEQIRQNERYEKEYLEKLHKFRQNSTRERTADRTGVEKKIIPQHIAKDVIVLGVLKKEQHLYLPDKNNKFTCLKSKEVIEYWQVNDDYCDCQDATDEPGTSACTDNKFYCSFQIEGSKALWVWSGQVHDGICDCCDGSDEWDNTIKPQNLQNRGAETGVYLAPCTDRCSIVVAGKLEKQKTRDDGLKIRQQYLHEINNNYANLDKTLYGQDGAWYYLYLHCYEIRAEKYVYNLCPFRSVTQQSPPGSPTNIGRDAKWLTHSYEEGYTLKMDGGDSQQCPERRTRTTVVEFACGLENKILGVHESESCMYSIQFVTPLACL